MPDAVRWFGDETWLMSEAETHIREGAVRLPIAPGSTLYYSKGFLLGVPWLSSLFYGLPLLILSGDPIATGRVVTWLMSGAMIVMLWISFKRYDVPILFGGTLLLLMTSSRAFLQVSHSSRPDMMCGLILLLVVLWLLNSERLVAARPKVWFIFGVVIQLLGLTSSIHLLTLLPPLVLVALYWYGKPHILRNTVYSAFGASTALLLLLFGYWLGNGSVTLWGTEGQKVQFNSVTAEFPGLRPFSRSVQVSNVVSRWNMMTEDSAILTYSLAAFFLIGIALMIRRRQTGPTTILALLLLAGATLSWLQFHSSHANYFIHVLPVVVLTSGLLMRNVSIGRITSAVLLTGSVGLFVLGVLDIHRTYAWSEPRVRNNAKAVSELVAVAKAELINPKIVAEAPMFYQMTMEKGVRFYTDHFTSFPLDDSPIPVKIDRLGVNFIMIWTGQHYRRDTLDDPFFHAVESLGAPIATRVGPFYDWKQSYFEPGPLILDTFTLYRWRGK